MLNSVKELRGYKILANDGEIGKVYDLYFDDKNWIVRYLVVDTGGWLSDRKVLISPIALEQPNWEDQVLPVNLTKEQVENSPGTDVERPVSRQHEIRLHKYYNWPYYWATAGTAGTGTNIVPPPRIPEEPEEFVEEAELEEDADPHLRSTREVESYRIQASDSEIGHVEDFIIDDEHWILRYIVVDTRNWLPGRKVLVAPPWIEEIVWAEANVFVDLPRDHIQNAPEYDPSAPIDREYEDRLYDYYDRQKYWQSS
ncbi:PRC-barrel domain containing protein [candidate division KSB1 bacterium]|nr:PRC-barrel domain containing protein [candidate division KSB1 bacterium]NIR71256.1 PRC-barrel domain containing protein [candidate division KSB1 bacterium]NIS24785.1 PRC-barrel domain containing protein [candidate division KSB1 bacterium]NIT71692.1 PRC-barrel domain containing protein [candidate division KSB1 bacterium]NIU25421.1 PRC-barrel domain containing protein [candidate division KSB1 bacterium]